MIQEDYVSFETAKLLKEKGFDGISKAYYIKYKDEEIKLWSASEEDDYNNGPYPTISAPTLQMAMKWLRREHGLHCSVDYDYVLGWYCQITSLKETVKYDYEEMKHYHPEKNNDFSSAEEACEEAIQYCLENLI